LELREAGDAAPASLKVKSTGMFLVLWEDSGQIARRNSSYVA
jgi:hypothetical protein